MKRTAVKVISILLALIVFGCGWEIPKAIEIKGKFGINNLNVDFDITELLLEELEDEHRFYEEFDFNGSTQEMVITVQKCESINEQLTLLIHVKIPFPVDLEGLDFISSIDEGFEDAVSDNLTALGNKIDEIFVIHNIGDDNLTEQEAEALFSDISSEVDKIIDNMIADIESGKDIDIPEGFGILDLSAIIANLHEDDLKESIKETIKESIFAKVNPGGRSLASDNLKDSLKEIILTTVNDQTKDAVVAATMRTELEVDGNHVIFNDTIEISLGDVFPDSINLNNFKIGGNDIFSKFYLSVKDKDNEGNYADDLLGLFDINIELFDEVIIDGTNSLSSSESNFTEMQLNKFTTNLTSLPQGGHVIGGNLSDVVGDLLDGEKAQAKFNIVIPDGTHFPLEILSGNYEVSAEIAMLLPLILEVKGIVDTTLFTLNPEDLDLDDDDDAFGRDPGDEISEYIKSIYFSLKLNSSVLNGINVKILNTMGSFEKNIILDGNSVSVNFSESEIKEIDRATEYPFIPKIEFIVKPNITISFPKDLILERVTLIADVDYYSKF